MRYDSAGKPYFIDHINKRSTYDDPRTTTTTTPSTPPPQPAAAPSPVFNHTTVAVNTPVATTPATTPAATNPVELPQGWEMRLDQQGRPYFIDHQNKK